MGSGGGREISSQAGWAVSTSTIALLQLLCPQQSAGKRVCYETLAAAAVCVQ